jgi:hypothetical protein
MIGTTTTRVLTNSGPTTVPRFANKPFLNKKLTAIHKRAPTKIMLKKTIKEKENRLSQKI